MPLSLTNLSGNNIIHLLNFFSRNFFLQFLQFYRPSLFFTLFSFKPNDSRLNNSKSFFLQLSRWRILSRARILPGCTSCPRGTLPESPGGRPRVIIVHFLWKFSQRNLCEKKVCEVFNHKFTNCQLKVHKAEFANGHRESQAGDKWWGWCSAWSFNSGWISRLRNIVDWKKWRLWLPIQ